jgi:hypothetical protein
MGYVHKFIKERNFVLSLILDGLNDDELANAVQELTRQTADMHPFVELADVTRLSDASSLTEHGVALAGTLEFDRKPYKRDRLAILVSSDEAYKLATKYAATSSYFRYDIKIFRDFKAAIAWLGVADIEDRINELRSAA